MKPDAGCKKYKNMKNDWKERLGTVYSTNPDFKYETDNDEEEKETLPNEKQQLRISLDKKNRGGKVVSLVTGFTGKNEDLVTLGKLLKVKCGVGGSAKDGEIIIQGDLRRKISEILIKEGYKVSNVK
jgi:translation initiation factor 1